MAEQKKQRTDSGCRHRVVTWSGAVRRYSGSDSLKTVARLALGLLLVISAFHAAEAPVAAAEESQEMAPDFYLKGLNGGPLSLSSQRGKVVVLTFWASWCQPCKEELASLNRLDKMFKGRGLAIIAVSIDRSESAAREYLSRNPLSFPALLDEQLLVSRRLYRIFGVPATVIIDKKGIIAGKRYGEPDWTKAEIVREIEALLQKK